MRIKITKSKNSENFYIIKSTYINKKHSTKIVEKLGNPKFDTFFILNLLKPLINGYFFVKFCILILHTLSYV